MALSLAADTLDDLLRQVFGEIQSSGKWVVASRGRSQEVVGATLELTNPRARMSRTETRRRHVSVIAELCWYLSGTADVAPIAFYLPRYNQEAEADGTVHGAYGPRLFGPHGRLAPVVELLAEKPSTRRAVVQIFDHEDLGPEPYKDVPCTCTLQFFVRGEQVDLVVHMRSNDAFFGLVHDVFSFTMLQEIVARALGKDMGRYVHMVGSLHLYEEHHDEVAAYLAEGWQSTTDPMPPMPLGDPGPEIERLLAAERGLRSREPYESLVLPNDPYWADLVRLLAAWVADRGPGASSASDAIKAKIAHDSFRDFL